MRASLPSNTGEKFGGLELDGHSFYTSWERGASPQDVDTLAAGLGTVRTSRP